MRNPKMRIPVDVELGKPPSRTSAEDIAPNVP